MTDALSSSALDASRANLARLVIGGVCCLGMLATFLPWVQAPIIGSISGARGDGWFSFGGFGLALLVSMMPRPSAPLGIARRVVVALLSGACVALGVWKLVGLSNIRSEHEAQGGLAAAFSQGTSAGNGLWLLLFAGVAAVVLCVALRDRQPH